MTRLKTALMLALVSLPAARVVAQAPASVAKPATAPTPPQVPGVSAQGNAVIARIQKQGDPAGQAAVQKLRALLPQISQVATAPTIDVEKFATLLKQQDALTAQLQSRRNELMITILRQLPPADRGPFLKAIATRVPTAPAGR